MMLRLLVALLLAVAVSCQPTHQKTNSKQKSLSQPIGLSGHFITTSIGIGTPPQFFDLALDTSSDKTYVTDVVTENAKIDYSYDYVKTLFIPEMSDTVNMTSVYCRKRYQCASCTTTYQAMGSHADDTLTVAGKSFETPVRYCDLDEKRTEDSQYEDKLKWFMQMPVDGFLGLSPGGDSIFQKVEPDAGLSRLTIYYNKSAKEKDNTGVITFGGQDTDNCKNFRTFPSDDADAWTFWITQAKFNSEVESGFYATKIDLSSEKLIVPATVYTDITSYFSGSGSYYCSSYQNIPDLKVSIYGKDYKIPIQPYLVPQSGSSTYCSLNVDSATSTDQYQFVLDKHFLSKNCLYLDYAQQIIGLSDLK